MPALETMVRMGELATSREPGRVLVSLGLGSCIGLGLIDRRMGIAGLAHIVLPQAQGDAAEDNPHKFADRAVPAMLSELEELGARRIRLEAVLVGGASMFAVSSSSLEVGQRNEAAVREILIAERIPVVAAATGGSRGRTVRIDVGSSVVTVREAGGKEEALLGGAEVLEVVV
jgi:chemotaxis protein CheD